MAAIPGFQLATPIHPTSVTQTTVTLDLLITSPSDTITTLALILKENNTSEIITVTSENLNFNNATPMTLSVVFKGLNRSTAYETVSLTANSQENNSNTFTPEPPISFTTLSAEGEILMKLDQLQKDVDDIDTIHPIVIIILISSLVTLILLIPILVLVAT